MSEKIVDIGTQTTASLIDEKIGNAIGINPIPQEALFSGNSSFTVGVLTGGYDSAIALNYNGELYAITDETKGFYRMTNDMGCWDNYALSIPYTINVHESCFLVYDNPVTEKTEIHLLGGFGYKSKAHYKWDGERWSVASEIPYDFCGGKAIVYNNEIHIFGGGTTHYSSTSSNGYINYHYKWDGASWEKASTPSFNMKGSTPVVFNGAIWMIGNISSSEFRNIYIFSNGKWDVGPVIPSSFSGVTNASTIIYDRSIHIVGGDNTSGAKTNTHLIYTPNIGWANGEPIPSDGLCDSSNGLVMLDNEMWIIGYRGYHLNSRGKWIAYQDIGYAMDNGVVISLESINGNRLVFFENDTIIPIEPLDGIEIDSKLPYTVTNTDSIVVAPNGDIHAIIDSGSTINHYKYIKTIENNIVKYTLSPDVDSLPKHLKNISVGFYKGNLHVFGDYDGGYNQFVLDYDGWRAISTAPFKAANSKIVTVNKHLYAIVLETSSNSSTIKVAEFNGNLWLWLSSTYDVNTVIKDVVPIGFQEKLHVIFLDSDGHIRHIIYSGSSFCECDTNHYNSYTAIDAAVRNNILHTFGTNGDRSDHFFIRYGITGKMVLQVFLPKGHQIICNKNEIIPLWGLVEESENGYISTDSGNYRFLITSDDNPIYSII